MQLNISRRQLFNGAASELEFIPFDSGEAGINGTASLTQAAHTVSSAGTVLVAGSASLTQDTHTVSSAGVVRVAGTASLTQDAHTLSSVGTVRVAGSASLTQDAHTLSSTGVIGSFINGTASLTQDAHTLSSAGQIRIAALANLTQASHTLSSAGTVVTIGGGGGLTAAQVWAYEIEPGFTAESLMRLMAAVLLGKVSGAGTGEEIFRDVNDTKNRVTSNSDSDGNRTKVTLDAS